MRSRGCGCLAGIPVLLFGMLFVGVGLVMLVSTSRQHADFIRTDGVVIDLRVNSDSDGNTYTPVIEFQVAGETYRFVSSISRSPAPDIGDTVGVLYNPTNPLDAVEDSALLWVFPAIALLVGIPATAIGVFLFVRTFRRATPAPAGGPTTTVPATTEPRVPAEPGPTTLEDVLTGMDDEPTTDGGDRPAKAQFRRVEPRGPDAQGRFQYRVVARDEAGNRYYSEWVDEDPTTGLLEAGVDELPLRWDGSRAVVEGF